jgi:hypothetical protein
MTKERVTNEQATEWKNSVYTDKETKDLSADLLDARKERDEAIAMIREMRKVLQMDLNDIRKINPLIEQLGYHAYTQMESKLVEILEKSNRYAE